jgi:hypothetical protein
MITTEEKITIRGPIVLLTNDPYSREISARFDMRRCSGTCGSDGRFRRVHWHTLSEIPSRIPLLFLLV